MVIELSPYYKSVINIKLITTAAVGTTLGINLTLTDNSSNSQHYLSYHGVTIDVQAIYLTVSSKNIKDRTVNISIQSFVVNDSVSVPLVGLAQGFIQTYPCPVNCQLCYNAELCIQCENNYFNTPQYLCVSQCIGYL